METLKKRQDFVKIASGGVKWVTPAFVLQMGCDFISDHPLIGFTASRKIGGAVKRNRAKRRLRVLAAHSIVPHGRNQFGYVVVARHELLTKSFTELKDDMEWALKRIHTQWDEKHGVSS